MPKSYILLGVILVLGGAILALFSYIVIGSITLTAVGISTLIIGLTSIGLANSRPKLSPEACLMFLEAGTRSIQAMLEDLEVKNKAIYLPRSMMHGRSQTLILFDEVSNSQRIYEILSDVLSNGYEVSLPLGELSGPQLFKEKLPRHFFLEYSGESKRKVLAVTTLGNISLDLLMNKPGHSADDIKSALTYILTKILDMASGVKVDVISSTVKIEITGTEIMNKEIFHEETLYSQFLGSPVASVAAAICSEALEKPIRITFETYRKGKVSIVLEVIH